MATKATQQNATTFDDYILKTVSVIIAAYKAADFVEEALRSALEQELQPGYQLQLILGIDGCDETIRVLSRLHDERLEVYRMDRNYGTYVTFNTMMQFAKGDLIVRFDADDIMLPGYLSRQLEVFEGEPEIHLTWTRSRYIDSAGEVIPEPLRDESKPETRWEIRSAAHGQFMMRRQLWEALGAFQPWPCTSDSDFIYRMRFAGFREEGIREVLYLRRIHAASLTQSEETGYESAVRKEYRERMFKAKEERKTAEDCWVQPVVGEVIR